MTSAGYMDGMDSPGESEEWFPPEGHRMLCVGGPLHGHWRGFDAKVLLIAEPTTTGIIASVENGSMEVARWERQHVARYKPRSIKVQARGQMWKLWCYVDTRLNAERALKMMVGALVITHQGSIPGNGEREAG